MYYTDFHKHELSNKVQTYVTLKIAGCWQPCIQRFCFHVDSPLQMLSEAQKTTCTQEVSSPPVFLIVCCILSLHFSRTYGTAY